MILHVILCHVDLVELRFRKAKEMTFLTTLSTPSLSIKDSFSNTLLTSVAAKWIGDPFCQ